MKNVNQPRNLAQMIAEQGLFSGKVRAAKGSQESDADKLLWSKEYTLAAMIELGEVVDHLKWKPHRAEHHFSTFDRDGMVEEGVDVFNYLMALLEMHGVTGEEFEEVWRAKYLVLEQRQYQEVTNPLREGEPVVMVDLDGVVADFRSGLLQWLQKKMLMPWDFRDPNTNMHCDLDWGLDPLEYRQAKWDFEAEGGYARLPKFELADVLMAIAQSYGRIVFVTSRTVPLKRIYRDTLMWIRTHYPNLEFVLFIDEKKAERLALHKLDVQFCIEDDPKIAVRLLAAGYKVLMPKHPYNALFIEQYMGHKVHSDESVNCVTLVPQVLEAAGGD